MANRPFIESVRPFGSIAVQLAEFNRSRQEEYGRAPRNDERLPIPFTMIGADIPDEPPAR